MTGLLSAISGQFSKAVVLGASLPVTVFVILWLILIEPLFPADASLLQKLGIFGAGWQVAATAFLTVVLTGLLFVLNIPIIRFYEGYPWEDTFLGAWARGRYRSQHRELMARVKGMRTLLRSMKEEDPGYTPILNEWSRMNRQVLVSFPLDAGRILPTSLGNTIRSFESYPEAQYSMEGITLWTRLIAKIDKDYAAGISDAKTSFDFMLNSSMLSAILALAILVTGLVFPADALASPARAIPWLVEVILFGFLSWLFYSTSISRAAAWGAMVKGAFDLYRWDLLKQLGYTQVPKNRRTERALWDKISDQIVYGDRPEGPVVDYADPPPPSQPTYVTGSLAGSALKLARGVFKGKRHEDLQVVLEVRNTDPEQPARDVVVVDTVPQGFDYEWESASRDGKPVPVEGVNPYRFTLGELKPEETAILTYRTILRETQGPG